MTLRARTLVLVALCVLPAFAVALYMAHAARADAAADAQRSVVALARIAAAEQQQLIGQARQILHVLAQLLRVDGLAEGQACNRILADAIRIETRFANFGVVGRDGYLRCSALPWQAPVYLGDRAYFRDAIASRAFTIGDFQVGRVTGRSSVHFGYPVAGENGATAGVVFAALELSWVQLLAANVELPQGSVVTVVDRNGVVLARHPEPERFVGRPLAIVKAGGAQSRGVAVGPDGVKRVYGFVRASDGADGVVQVGVGIPEQIVFARIERQFAWVLAGISVAAMVIGLLAWLGADVLVLRRIAALTTAAERFGAGDHGARTGLAHDATELGRLAGAFDKMAGRIARHQAEVERGAAALRRANRALRTLSASNRALLEAKREQPLLDEMCRIAVEIGGYAMALVGYAQHDAEKSIVPVASRGFEAEFLDRYARSWSDTPEERSVTGEAIRAARPAVVRDYAAGPEDAPRLADARRLGIGSAVAFPLTAEDRVLGAISIYAREPDAFDEDELEVLQELARDLAHGIEGIRLRERHRLAETRIERMAYFDRLTGLPNRAKLEETLGALLGTRGGRPLALVLLDLDRFLEVNTALGYRSGDMILKQAGARLAEASAGAPIAHLGEDMFAVVHEGDAGSALALARSLLRALEAQPFLIGELRVDVAASAGISAFPAHGVEVDALIRRAEAAMHRAKRSGAGLVVFSPELDAEKPERLALAAELRQGIERDELVLWCQPKVEIATGRFVGAETLVRWQHPTHGMVPPGEFIALAEHTGLIKPLTDWVVRTTVRTCREWCRQGRPTPLAVNISTRNLREPELPGRVRGLLHDWGVAPELLELEITESALIEDAERALETLKTLRAMGVRLSIDDFGTGYSSLGYLHRLPVDALKIDHSFVRRMLEDEGSAMIVRSTIEMAHNLALEVVAEGVETDQIYARLRELGCDKAQGYGIARPMPAAELAAWVEARG